MTSRTHDLAAFTTLSFVIVTQPIPQMTLATALVAFGANMIGGLLPDIDDETADIWDKIRAGSIISRIIHPLLGNHRMISHSVLGMYLIGLILKYVLPLAGKVLLVDMNIIWWSVMIGYLSHLIMDSFTKEGVPWLFPIPIRIGFPPHKLFRIKTGGIVEKAVVFPGLLVTNGYLFYTNYFLFLSFVKSFMK